MKFIFKISKSFSSDLKSKHKDGKWITSNGSHLFITGQGENRKVIAGLGGFNGLIDEYFKEQTDLFSKGFRFVFRKSIIPHKQLYQQQIAEKQNIDHEKLENGYMDKINNLFGNMGLNVSNGRQVSHLSSNEIDILNKFKKALKETRNLKQAVKLSGMNTTIFEKIKSLM